MEIKVLLFGITTDLLGTSEFIMEIEATQTVAMFKESLKRKYPKLKNLSSYAIAVNESYASDDELLKDQDTVAIIPPVSGG